MKPTSEEHVVQVAVYKGVPEETINVML